MSDGRPPDAEPENPAALEDDPGLDINLLRRRREKVLAILAVGVILAAATTIAYYLLRAAPVTRTELIGATHQVVEETLGSGLVYAFSPPAEFIIDALPGGNFAVSANVAAITRQGLGQTYQFKCILTRRQGARGWAPVKLELTTY